ncbi:MAG: hypothetical protein AB8E82_07210 [Aureispira sp.]
MPTNEKLRKQIESLRKAKKIVLKMSVRNLGLPPAYEDVEKQDELINMMLDNPKITDIKTIIRMVEDDPRKNPLYITEDANKNALKNTYNGFHSLAVGLLESALDVAIVRQLQTDIRIWLRDYQALTILSIKDDIKRLSELLTEDLATLPDIIQKAQDFETAYNNDDLNPDTVNVDTLLVGLKRFNKNATQENKGNYLDRLKVEHATNPIVTYAAAAAFLFSDVELVMQTVNEFKLAKKIIVDYPSNTIGTYYRGDNRNPDKLNFGGKGFTAFKPMSVEEARAMAKKWFGAEDPTSPTAYHEEHIRKNLSEYISLGNDIGCMGYGCIGVNGANRNVYQIRINGLSAVPANLNSLGIEPHDTQGPTLIMNANTVDAATVIAVKGAVAGETTFFTGINSGVRMIYQKPNANENIEGGWIDNPQNL